MNRTRTSRLHKAVLVSVMAAAAMSLASCGGMYPKADRQYGTKQVSGWTTSSGVREAEQKSIARDMPFAAVSAKGDIVQR